jgi:hypothetical protein
MAGRRGRPTKRSVAAIRAITGALAAGNTRTNAARLGGIDYATLKRWCRLSAPFCAALETAEAKAEGRYVGNIRTAASKGNWQAAAWWLERRRTGDWRKPSERVEISDYRKEAEAIAAEIGKPELVDAIERDILISVEAQR